MAITSELTIADGNLTLIDRTRAGVAVQVAAGVTREDALNRWFARHVACPPWRDLSAREHDVLRNPTAPASPSKLYVFDFPPRLCSLFWERYIERVVSAGSDSARKATLEEFRQALLEAFGQVPGLKVCAVRTFDVMFAAPGSPSTAFDPRSRMFVGLHLDDHENLGFEDRGRGFQLLSINLGQAERYFQFINHDAASLLRLVGGLPALPAEARSAASLVQCVFRMFPDCPVLRLTLRPGQGYLAVTQDLIHDGATNDRGRPDVSCLLAGRFDVRGNEGDR
jgi:hypothetical protein